INRAVNYINSTVIPKKNVVRIVKTDDYVERFDLEELTKVGDRVTFESLVDTPTMETIEDGNTTELEYYEDYKVELNRFLILHKAGIYNVYYKERLLQVTPDSQGDVVIQVDKRAEPLVAQLASFYIWLDDDEQKAYGYYNMFDNMKNGILEDYQRTLPQKKSRILGGIKMGGKRVWHR
ncbi:MAG: hypothetical protein GX025_10895, partial [Clostridiales bacterium]|nr:hypothetical protein [Clostridiales bacterium]